MNFSLTFILFHFETPQPFLLPLLAFLSPFVSHNYNNLFFSTNLSLFTFAVFVCVSFQKVTDVFFTRKKIHNMLLQQHFSYCQMHLLFSTFSSFNHVESIRPSRPWSGTAVKKLNTAQEMDFINWCMVFILWMVLPLRY